MATIIAPYIKIESFGAVDGPGVRLVIFLHGCPLRCIYCHNPESWATKEEQWKKISVDEVINLYLKNKSFYEKGGITISGGEPLIHKEFCLELAKQCYSKHINLAFDTSGVTFTSNNLNYFKKLIKYKPIWLIDIKHINPKKHKLITGISQNNELNLIKFLDKNEQHYWIRQVLVPGYTDNKIDLISLGQFIKKLKFMDKFELLPYHKLGISKYHKLKLKYPITNVKVSASNYIKKVMEIIKSA